MSRYINLYTDFCFKKLFGEEANKDLLIDFLNTLLPEKHQVMDLKFRTPELLGVAASERNVGRCSMFIAAPLVVKSSSSRCKKKIKSSFNGS